MVGGSESRPLSEGIAEFVAVGSWDEASFGVAEPLSGVALMAGVSPAGSLA